MENQSEITNPNEAKSQRNSIFALLWLFPLLIFIINASWYLFSEIRLKENENQRKLTETENEDLVKLKSDFSFAIPLISSRFKTELKTATQSFPDPKQKKNLISLIKSRADKYFGNSFPKNKHYIFEINNSTQKIEILHSNDDNPPKQNELLSTIESKVKSKEKPNEIRYAKIGTEGIYFADEQFYLLNYFENRAAKNIFGYLLFFNYDTDVLKNSQLFDFEENFNNGLNSADKKVSMPFWLQALNCLIVILAIFAAMAMLKTSNHPLILKRRSIRITCALSLFVPVVILCLTFFGYIAELKKAHIFINQSQIKSCIETIKLQKAILLGNYIESLKNLSNDRLLANGFKELYTADKTDHINLEAKNVLSRAIQLVNQNNSWKMPFLSLSIIDENMNLYSNLGNSFCPYYKGANENSISKDSTFQNDPTYRANVLLAQNKAVIEKNADKFSYLLQCKRQEKELNQKPNNSNPEKVLKENEINLYSAQTGLCSSSYLNAHNLMHKVKDAYNLVYDYIYIDGLPRFIICLSWREKDVNSCAIKTGINNLAINAPEIAFSAYKCDGFVLEPLVPNQRYGSDYHKLSCAAAKKAYLMRTAAIRNIPPAKASENPEKSYLAAEKVYCSEYSSIISKGNNLVEAIIPSDTFENTIIVGGIMQQQLDSEIFIKKYLLLGIIIISIIISSICLRCSITDKEAGTTKLWLSMVISSALPSISASFVFYKYLAKCDITVSALKCDVSQEMWYMKLLFSLSLVLLIFIIGKVCNNIANSKKSL